MSDEILRPLIPEHMDKQLKRSVFDQFAPYVQERSFISKRVKPSAIEKQADYNLRAVLYRAQSGICPICGKRMKALIKANIDHVTPRALGGKNHRNRLATHKRCNTEKADRPPTGCELIWLEAVNVRI